MIPPIALPEIYPIPQNGVSVSAHLNPNSNPRSSKSNIENFPPHDPNIHTPLNQSVSKSPPYRNQIDSPNCQMKVSASRVLKFCLIHYQILRWLSVWSSSTTHLHHHLLRNGVEEEEASNPHVKFFSLSGSFTALLEMPVTQAMELN